MRTVAAFLGGAISVLLPSMVFALADDYGTTAQTASVYCPQLVQTLQKGDRDARTIPTGQVSELQSFLTDYYDLDENILVGGYFGALTKQYVIKYQTEQGLPSLGIVGSMTRAAIAKSCGTTVQAQSSTQTSLQNTASPSSTPSVPGTVPTLPGTPSTPGSTSPSATIDPVSLATTTQTSVVITGTAKNTLSVAATVGQLCSQEGCVSFDFRGSSIPVVNGRYSIPVSGLRPGQNVIVIGVGNSTQPLTSGIIYLDSKETWGTMTLTVDGVVRLKTESISESQARDYCLKNSVLYGNVNLTCTFNNTVIVSKIATQVPAQTPTAPSTSTAPSAPAAPTTPPATPAGGTTSPTPPTGDTGPAALDLKINGSDGPIALNEGDSVTATWTSSGMKSCGLWGIWPSIGAQYANIPSLPSTSGSAQYYAYVPGYPNFSVRLRCTLANPGTSPTMDDTVVVTKATAASADDKTLANLASALIAIQSILNSMH